MKAEELRRDLLCRGIIDQVKLEIASGRYGNGKRLPSVRQYAKELGVNPNTVQKALLQLEEEGYLFTKRTAGRFVTNNLPLLERLKTSIKDEAVKRVVTIFQDMGHDKASLEEAITVAWEA